MQSRTFLSCFSRSKPVSARSRMQRLLGWSHLNAKHLGLCSGFLCIYIREIIVVRRWTIHCACHSKWKNVSFKKNQKLKAAFFRSKLASPARTNSLEQMLRLVRLKLFLCKAVSTDIIPGFLCNAAAARTCILLSFKHAAPTHVCFVLAKPTFGAVVYMCKERYHPIPNPPQPTPLWSPANDNDLGYTYILWPYFIFVCYYVCLRVSNCLVWTLNLNIEDR